MQVKNTIVASIICMTMTHLVWSQDQEYDTVDGEVQDAEILVEKERKIELSLARKQYEFIRWKPQRTAVQSPPRQFEWYLYDVAHEHMDFTPAEATMPHEEVSYRHYAKAGFGNYISPLLDVSLTSEQHDSRMAGLNVKHQSFAKGEVDDKNSGSGTTEAQLYGVWIKGDAKLKSTMDYRLDNHYYYGYPAGTVVNREDIRHRSNFFNFDATIGSIDIEEVWRYQLELRFRHYSDNFKAGENSFLGKASIGYGDKLYIDTEFVVSKYQDEGINQSRSYIRLQPYYSMQIEQVILDVGLSISTQNDDYPELAASKFFPFVKATYAFHPNYTLFGKLDGGFDYFSLYDVASEVPILNQSVPLINSDRWIDFSGGVTGNPVDPLSVKATAGFQSVRYLPIVMNNAADQSRIDITYDDKISKIFTLQGEAIYEVAEEHQLKTGFSFYHYSSEGYDQIYHRPTTVFLLSGDHQILPKLNAKWDFSWTGGLVARNQSADQDIRLDAIPRLDVLLHYHLKEQWGLFLSGDNLIGKKYARYLYYPQRGIQIKGGVTLMF